MSLLSPESLSVFIAPTELVAVRWRGFPRQIVEKQIITVAGIQGKAWDGAAQNFADLVHDTPSCRHVRVLISSHFASYQLLPWRDDLNNHDEELAVARMAFAETYGTLATQWQIRLSDEAPGLAKMAVAVDSGLLAALQQATDRNNARLDSVQPTLAATINHWREHFGRSASSWIVLHEEGRLCIALIERGAWRWVHSLRIGADWAESLPDILDNETLLAGIENSPTKAFIFSPATSELPVLSCPRWSLHYLSLDTRTNFSPASDGRFGYALIG